MTHEAVRSRLMIEALLAALPPKQAHKLILEMNARMDELDTTDIRRIRSPSADAEVRKARLAARALWTAQLPRFIKLLRRRKYRPKMRE